MARQKNAIELQDVSDSSINQPAVASAMDAMRAQAQEDQLELLRSNGCDEIQGYLFSKPLNSATAFAFLHARHAAE